MGSLPFYILYYRKSSEIVRVIRNVEVIILGEYLEGLIQMRAYGSSDTTS